MGVLVVLIVTFLASLGITWAGSGEPAYILSGNIAMCAMLQFTALGHFKFPEGMKMMIPPFVPFKKALVLITGLIEIAAGIALLFPATRYAAGIFLILFFIALLPANIYAASQHLDYQKGTYDGKGPAYLWFRIPMQAFLIAWVWYFAVQPAV
ncbi:DoxX family protein [Dyadobacter jiangsuensis]|uniref:DoxX family protein n=1 Tax=Dyadobacter fermentans TaxID=94254 RepID=UPI001CBF71EB|nr:hypothetical protein [Dyadobacter fermentans]MBZ1358238.1 hypothetical protein [Dyadobacter fermentans]